MPQAVINRAIELLDTETRQMGEMIEEMENQKFIIDQQVIEMEKKKEEIERMAFRMKENEIRYERKMLTARRDEARKFSKKLEEKESILEDILFRLKSDPSRKLITKSWEDIKCVKREVFEEAENVPSVAKKKKASLKAMEKSASELIPLSAETKNRSLLAAGEKVLVCKKGKLFGKEALVVKDSGKQLTVNISGGISLTMSDGHLSRIGNSSYQEPENMSSSRLSKTVKKALDNESRNVDSSLIPKKNTKKRALSMRIDSNTVDVRACNFLEAQEKITMKISDCNVRGIKSIYILHGHGHGGVLKSKLRDWLKNEKTLIKKWSPCEQGPDGGDAFTRIEV